MFSRGRAARPKPPKSVSLHDAVNKDRLNDVLHFLDQGVPPDDPGGRTGFTPLQLAAFHERLRIASVLLERGASVDAVFVVVSHLL